MKGKFLAVLCLGFVLFLASCSKKEAPAPVSSDPTFDWDAGPADIDQAVKAYPKDIQATYNTVFKVKCNQCHTLARSINAPYYDEATWTKIVTKMSTRPGSPVTSGEISKLVKFLVYDHQKRKAEIEKLFADNHWTKRDPVLP